MKNIYLQRMGITTWRLRDQPTHAVNYFSYQLNNAAGKPLGVLFADAIDDSRISLSEQENLVQNIVAALTPHFTNAMNENHKHYLFAILLGNHAKKMFLERESKVECMISHDALIQFIQNTERKKALWTEIKPLRDLFIL